MEPRAQIDMWTTLMDAKKREYIAEGMSEEDAEDKACAEVRAEIRRG
jgi:hypothetical protein